MPRRQVTAHAQAGAHGTLGIGSDEAGTGARGLADNDGVADIDAQFLELGLVEQAVAIVADAAEKSSLPTQLRKSDNGVGDRTAADQSRLVLSKAMQQRLLLRRLHQAHRAALKTERRQFLVGQLDEDVHQGIAESVKLELSHPCLP